MDVNKQSASRSTAEKNKDRKHRKKQAVGTVDAGVSREQHQAKIWRKRNNVRLGRAYTLGKRVPDDVNIMTLATHQPAIYNYLQGGNATLDKNHNHLTNRAIWYNEFDTKHTFNRYYRNCRANLSIVSHHEVFGTVEKVPQLQMLYYNACQEARGKGQQQDNPFAKRELFLDAWKEYEHDIANTKPADMKPVNEMTKRLLVIFPSLSSAFTAATVDDEHLVEDHESDAANKNNPWVKGQESATDEMELDHNANYEDLSVKERSSAYDKHILADGEHYGNVSDDAASQWRREHRGLNPIEWTVNSSRYKDDMESSEYEEDRGLLHQIWVQDTLLDIAAKISELLDMDPPDYDTILRLWAKYHQMDDEEDTRLLLEKF